MPCLSGPSYPCLPKERDSLHPVLWILTFEYLSKMIWQAIRPLQLNFVSTSSSFFFSAHVFSKCLQCSFHYCSSVINFFVDCNICPYSSFSLAQHRTPQNVAVALVVQHPLKISTQNLQTSFFAPPFLASGEFETVKYCQIRPRI